jgi:hypothetical protein
MSDPVEVIARAIAPSAWGDAGFMDNELWRDLTRAKARAALSALEGEGMVVGKGWKPIETAPKAGVIDLWADGLRWPDCYWVEGTTGYWTCQGVGPIDNPTHWMRLPEPPEPR